MLEVKSNFEERFYHWSLEQWNRELQSNFKYLRAIHFDIIARRAVRIFDSYESDHLHKLLKAFAKRTVGEDILERCSEKSLTLEEKELIECFVNHLQDEAWRETSRIPSGGFKDTKNQEKFNKKVFRKAVISELTPLFGSKYENRGGGEIAYKIPIGTWELVTLLDFGSRIDNLNYSHYIMDKHGNVFAERISILRWLGISGETSWQELTNDDIEEASKTCAEICTHFVNEVPKLLDGLDIE